MSEILKEVIQPREQEVVLKLVNMSPEEIATLPPNERAGVMQFVRPILLFGLGDRLTRVWLPSGHP
jgi:hypothetical protein